MARLLLALVFLLLALAGVAVRKAYYQVPVRELKRRAARHDHVAERLYRAVAYGSSTRTLLWLYIALTSAASVVLLTLQWPIWPSIVAVGVILWLVFSLIPATRVTVVGERLALIATPIIVWILNYLHPALNRGADKIESRYVYGHTRLFEREDLLELIERQGRQPDSRFTAEELEIAKRALQFDEHNVGDIIIPLKKIKTVLADETLGPVVIDEVVKTNQPFALVREDKKGPLVGVLEVSQLGIKSSGQVRDIMRPNVYYLHEDDRLNEALHAFFVTNFPVFAVVNSHEELLGIITVEQILQQLLGHIPGEDFDQYADLAAVVTRHLRAAEQIEASVNEDEQEKTN